MADLSFATFSAANRKRYEEDLKRKLGTRDAIVSMAIGLAEEAGEVAGAVDEPCAGKPVTKGGNP